MWARAAASPRQRGAARTKGSVQTAAKAAEKRRGEVPGAPGGLRECRLRAEGEQPGKCRERFGLVSDVAVIGGVWRSW
jgi:hypothetical protein